MRASSERSSPTPSPVSAHADRVHAVARQLQVLDLHRELPARPWRRVRPRRRDNSTSSICGGVAQRRPGVGGGGQLAAVGEGAAAQIERDLAVPQRGRAVVDHGAGQRQCAVRLQHLPARSARCSRRPDRSVTGGTGGSAAEAGSAGSSGAATAARARRRRRQHRGGAGRVTSRPEVLRPRRPARGRRRSAPRRVPRVARRRPAAACARSRRPGAGCSSSSGTQATSSTSMSESDSSPDSASRRKWCTVLCTRVPSATNQKSITPSLRQHPAADAGLLVDLADRGLLGALPRLQVPLRQGPEQPSAAVQAADQHPGRNGRAAVDDQPAGGDLGHRAQPPRGGFLRVRGHPSMVGPARARGRTCAASAAGAARNVPYAPYVDARISAPIKAKVLRRAQLPRPPPPPRPTTPCRRRRPVASASCSGSRRWPSSSAAGSPTPATSWRWWADRCATPCWVGSARTWTSPPRPARSRCSSSCAAGPRRSGTSASRSAPWACARGGFSLEITTYRSDAYDRESRKPEVEFGDTLAGDLDAGTSRSTRWRCGCPTRVRRSARRAARPRRRGAAHPDRSRRSPSPTTRCG